MPLVGSADLESAHNAVSEFLERLIPRDWQFPVPDLEWSCERTLQHVVNTQLYFALLLAARASSAIPFPRGPAAATGLTPAELLAELQASTAVLAEVIRCAPSGARAWCGGVFTDAEGFAALGCDELLVHTWDIARGFNQAFTGPDALVGRILQRLFPWAPKQLDRWSVFLWCNGRMALDERPRLEPDWPRWLAPLDQWDGIDPTISEASSS